MKRSSWYLNLILCFFVLIFLFGLFPDDYMGSAQEQIDPDLLVFINSIRAIDNHCHYSASPDPKTLESKPSDPLGKSPAFFDARQREDNPRWIQAWHGLYGYAEHDFDEAHIRELFRKKLSLMREKGADYPGWIMDQIGIDVALINSPQLGSGQVGRKFRWVPLADGFLLPFEFNDPTGNVQRRRKEIGIGKLPPSLTEYLDQIVTAQLARWQHDGAIAIKFQIAYYRSLDFANPRENDAKAVYERYVGGGFPSSAEYKLLQDFLFRYVARQAGHLGLSVHIHTGEGGGPLFGTTGSNPLLLEPVLNDYGLQETIYVLVHGGFPFDRTVSSLIKKPNVYADISGQTFFRSRNELSETIQPWLETFPEKVMFGTDAFDLSPLRGWEEMAWIATKTGREALALALTRMISTGEVTKERAKKIALMVMRENALRVYRLDTR